MPDQPSQLPFRESACGRRAPGEIQNTGLMGGVATNCVSVGNIGATGIFRAVERDQAGTERHSYPVTSYGLPRLGRKKWQAGST